MQATYSLGIWNNVQTSNPQTYLTSTVTGAPTFAGLSAFASNKYIWDQTHLNNAVSIKSDTKGIYDFDLSASTIIICRISCQSVHGDAVRRRFLGERQDHPQ